MTRADLLNAASFVEAAVDTLSQAVPAAGETGAEFRRLAGDLSSNARARIEAGIACTAFAGIVDAAVACGADITELDGARATVSTSEAFGDLAGRLRSTFALLLLVAEAGIVADTTFVSRDQVDSTKARLSSAFGGAIDAASDAGDLDSFRALVALHGALVRDLVARSRPLPRMTAFDFGERVPALWLANRLYGDADRAAEIIAENGIVHPLFAPGAGRALSA